MSGIGPDNDHKGHHHDSKDAIQQAHLEVRGRAPGRVTSPQRQHFPSPSPRLSPRTSPQLSPEDKHSGHHYDTKKATEPAHLEVPGQKAGRAASPGHEMPLRSCLSPRPDHRRKQDVNVRWASGVVFNEHKMQSRPNKSDSSAKPWRSREDPSGYPAPAKSPTANTSAKIDPVHSRQPSHHFPQSYHSSGHVHPQISRGRAPQSSSHRANTSSKKVSPPKKGSTEKLKRAAPAVPDPPRDPRRPPPAPRPARLPSPDLPEINPGLFYIPWEMYLDPKHWEGDAKVNPVQEKVDAQCIYDFEHSGNSLLTLTGGSRQGTYPGEQNAMIEVMSSTFRVFDGCWSCYGWLVC